MPESALSWCTMFWVAAPVSPPGFCCITAMSPEPKPEPEFELALPEPDPPLSPDSPTDDDSDCEDDAPPLAPPPPPPPAADSTTVTVDNECVIIRKSAESASRIPGRSAACCRTADVACSSSRAWG